MDIANSWKKSGYLHLQGFFDEVEHDKIKTFATKITEWADTPGKWMKYYEATPAGDNKVLCRIENFLPYHQPLYDLILQARVWDILQTLMQEPAVLFKEKINFKFPGGKGFAAHQDAPAFKSFAQDYHITALIPIDDFSIASGCLEIVEQSHASLLKTAEDGTIDATVADELTWQPLPCKTGDLLLFDSYLPHRSGENISKNPRRGIYLTFNKQSAGDRRADYYALKRQHFPQDCEREAGVNYEGGVFNVANPIK